MKKSIRKIVVLLLSLMVLTMCLTPTIAQADYTYRVRVFVGNQADPDKYSPDVPVYDEVFAAGAYCDLPMDLAQSTLAPGSKYYVKGFKVSGEGGETYCSAPNFQVDGDYDFIIAYGMPDNLVSYTINFVDAETGAALADPVTYYGNVGDKPVVAYEYIEGYRPLYRNITGTLEAGGNIWSFPYLKLTPAQPAEEETTTAAQEQTTPAQGGQGGQGGNTPAGQTTQPQTDASGRVIQSEEVTTQEETNANGEVVTQSGAEGVPNTPAGGTGGNTPAGAEDIPDVPGGTQTGGDNAAEPEGEQTAGDNEQGNAAGNGGGIDLGGNAGVLENPELYEFAETEDILDLDVPLAAPNFGDKKADDGEGGDAADAAGASEETTTVSAEGGTTAKGLSTPVIVIIVCVCAIVIIIILLLVFKKKKK